MLYDKIQESIQYLRTLTDFRPKYGIILGTGLGNLTDEIETIASIDYKDTNKSSIDVCITIPLVFAVISRSNTPLDRGLLYSFLTLTHRDNVSACRTQPFRLDTRTF